MSERRRIWDMDDMPVERDQIKIFGELYELAGSQDVSAQHIAEILRLEKLVREQGLDDDDDLTNEQVGEAIELIKTRTKMSLFSEIPDEVLDRLSVRQHEFIYVAFSEASSESGGDLDRAVAKAQTENQEAT